MKPRVIDLGFGLARIEENDGKPLLTIVLPANNDTPAQSMEIYDALGLVELSDALASWLMEWNAEQRDEDVPQ